jgi:drug/metabolite transporter (DMT)-like permease
MGLRKALTFGTVALAWGSTYFWIKAAMRGMSSSQVTTARVAAGAGTLMAAVAIRRQSMPRGRAIWGHLAVIALLNNALPFLLLAVGKPTEEDADMVSVFNASVPLCALGTALALRKGREEKWTVPAGLLIGFGGILLIFAPWKKGTKVASWASAGSLVATGAYGGSMVYMQWLMEERDLSPLVLSASQVLLSAGWSVLMLPWGGFEPMKLSGKVVGSVAVIGILNNGLVYMLFVRMVRDDGATVASSVCYAVPVVLVLLDRLISGKQISGRQALGLAAASAGAILPTWRRVPAAIGHREPSMLTAD